MLQPLRIVAARKSWRKCAPRLSVNLRAVRDGEGELEHFLHSVGCHQFRVGAGRMRTQPDAWAAREQLLQASTASSSSAPVRKMPTLPLCDLLHLLLDGARVLAAAAPDHGVQLHRSRSTNSRINLVGMLTSLAGLEQKSAMYFTHDHAGDDRLGHRVAAQPVEAVHVPARRLARGEEALQCRALAGGQVRTPPIVQCCAGRTGIISRTGSTPRK